MDLSSSVTTIPGIGSVMAGKLKKLGINTIFDLLYYLPFRYEDRSIVSKTTQARVGETVTVMGTLCPVKNFTSKSGRRMQVATLTDDYGKLNIAWFNQLYLAKVFAKPTLVTLYGKVEFFGSKPTMFSPQYEIGQALGIVPIYHETAGLTSKWLRSKIQHLISSIPDEIIPGQSGWKQALTNIHFPKKMESVEPARQRLAFDELFLLQLSALKHRQEWNQTNNSPSFRLDQTKLTQFEARLPFVLTASQKQAVEEIAADLQHTTSMNRLLLGDVGSGKTVVAAVAAYLACLNNFQTLILAPTQILALQHYQTLSSLFKPFNINIGLATTHDRIIVGTHTLLFKDFKKVGLVVIDEQHRFGVDQRAAITAKGRSPHVLTMTATPIPRTVALTKYANLDLSVLTDKPLRQKPVKTWVVPETKRLASYNWITAQLTTGHSQAFWVCPLIEESETLISVKSAKAEFEKLKEIFPRFRLALLHGKMKAKEKDKVIKNLRDKKIDILVSTPVVEVGMDIPGATLMVIEAADRFGLASLHQLRGRVGRSDQQSYCLLFSDTNLDRLKNLEKFNSGPELAEIDFRARGPGQMYGTAQHGQTDFRVATYADLIHLDRARKLAQETLANLAKWPTLRQLIQPAKIEPAN